MGEPEGERRVILGVPVDAVTYAETLAHMAAFVAGERLRQICTTNPEFLMAAQRDPAFMAILKRADLCLPDGVGLLWAAWWTGQPLKERVAGSDLIWDIAARAAQEGWRVFLLGAREGVAARCAAILSERHPGLTVAGTFSGSPHEKDDADLVAYGAPAQDKWIDRNRESLPAVRVAMGVGGAFDFVTGEARRAPRWLRQIGFEWLHRLLHEPWRWRRQLALPSFVLAVLLRGRRPPPV